MGSGTPSVPTRVLLLEDSLPDAELIRDALERAPNGRFLLEHVDTVAAAVERLSHERFDVAVLDLCVADGEGLETLRAVSRAAPFLPIVIQSGLCEDALTVEAVRLGAQDYIQKDDLEPRVLVRALRYAIERKRIEMALRESEERYALAVRGANDGLWDWDVCRNRVFLSARWLAMAGLPPEERTVPPQTWFDRVHPDHRERLAAEVKRHLDGRTPHLEHEYLLRHEDGTHRWVLCRGLAVRDAEGRAIRLAGSQADVTHRKEAEARLVHDALHDTLTGLPNRALFLDRLEHALRRARRHPPRQFAVLFLDLDRFKVVNDSLGHLVGDQLLVEISRRLQATVRPGDTVARLGGDEFAVLLEDVLGPAEAESAAVRINGALSTPVFVGGSRVFTSASVGIVYGDARYDRPEALLRDADAAMYRAKNDGRSRHATFDEALHQAAVARLELEAELRHALERGDFSLHYQPIVSLRDGATVRFEALLRWRSPTRGSLGPAEFVPLLEETGLVVPVGEWALRAACRQLREWRECRERDGFGNDTVAVSVNVSGVQFNQPDFVEQVRSALEDADIPGACLILEVTESVLMENPDTAVETLRTLRGLGVGIEIDDFGTGYSSLSYLQRFPIDGLKIDRSFVRGMSENRGELEIVRAVLSLARSLGIGVVAEGIETVEQLSSLRLLDCELGQGFLFSEPVPEQFARISPIALAS